ncbi:hypothetical protein JCM11251_002565 [Rhodosporidiobolus azoricus]
MSAPPTWPRVGDIFPSVEHFKQACYARALQKGVGLVIDMSSPSRCDLRCRLRSDSTACSIGTGDPCIFSIVASADGSSEEDCQGTEVTVYAALTVHSCDRELRKMRAAGARAFMEARLKVVEEQIKQKEEEKAVEPASDDEGEEDDGEGPGRRKSVEKARKRMRCSGRSRDDSDSDASKSSSASSSFSSSPAPDSPFPSAFKLKNAINALLADGPVSFPSSPTSFASARDLLTHLHAYAQQRHFALYRSSDYFRASYIKILCTRGHSRYSKSTEGRCPMFVEARKGEHGSWTVTDESRKHNHDLEPTIASTPSSNAIRPKTAKRSRRVNNSAPAIQPSCHPRSLPAQLPVSSPVALPQPAQPVSSSSATFHSDLSAFLLGLSPSLPPAQASLDADLLLFSGIVSQDDLGARLLAEQFSVDLFLQELAQLPSVGDVFDNVRDFKLACPRAALVGAYEIKTLCSSNRMASMACRLRTKATTAKVTGGEACSLKIRLSKAKGVFRVTYASHAHSCDPVLRHNRRAQAVAWTEAKIAKLDPGKSRDGDGTFAQSGNSRVRRDEEDTEASEESDYDEDTWPSARALKADIADYLKDKTLSVPTATDAFTSAFHLSLHLHAFAVQNDFSIYHMSIYHLADWVRFGCSLNHARFHSAEGGRCKCTFVAEKNDDGIWHVVESTLEHTHPLNEQEPAAGREQTRSGSTLSDHSSLPLPPAHRRNDFWTPSYSSTKSLARFDESLQPDQSTCTLRPPYISPPPLTSKPFPLQLRIFLATFSPQPQEHLDLFHASLLSLGLGSTAHLASLFLFEEETLFVLFEQLQSVGVPKTTLTMFLQTVEEARKVAFG